MKTKRAVIISDKRMVATREQNKGILKAKTELCHNCCKNIISVYEVELCDFCADDLRYTPRFDNQY
jgi:hypothetical protein